MSGLPRVGREAAAEAAFLELMEAYRALLTAPVASARVHTRIRAASNRFQNIALLVRDERRQREGEVDHD